MSISEKPERSQAGEEEGGLGEKDGLNCENTLKPVVDSQSTVGTIASRVKLVVRSSKRAQNSSIKTGDVPKGCASK